MIEPSLAAGAAGRHHSRVAITTLDQESADWLRDLAPGAARREATVGRLHALLLRVTRAEAARRRASLPERGAEEVDDLCQQAASDAVLAILTKLASFRGEARFTTWACKFAILEISARLRRHAWRERKIVTDETVWETVPDRAPTALAALQGTETLALVRRAIHEQLSERQRLVFTAAVLQDVPIDVLAERLGSTRGAVYKVLHDARSRLRAILAAADPDRDPPDER